MTILPLIKSFSSAIGYTMVTGILGLAATEDLPRNEQEAIMGIIIAASLVAITYFLYPLFRREHENQQKG